MLPLRPSVHPQLCRNRDDLVGNEIFKNGDNPGDIAATLVAQANPGANYLVSQFCENVTLKSLALRECAFCCVFCCKTKHFDCSNEDAHILVDSARCAWSLSRPRRALNDMTPWEPNL
ncbi:unnamed protein product [Dracunculus medinensis]|uniref:ShKT domain-containing protein n=1 Tax=Dracunculus medinensis TaxID=318479 RepID=A0A0N4UPZ2_DRAME|nr:unnamed protein product [Dracunculus medinensis]